MCGGGGGGEVYYFGASHRVYVCLCVEPVPGFPVRE